MTEQCNLNGYASVGVFPVSFHFIPVCTLFIKLTTLTEVCKVFLNLSVQIPGHCLPLGLEHFHILLIHCSLSGNNLMNIYNLHC